MKSCVHKSVYRKSSMKWRFAVLVGFWCFQNCLLFADTAVAPDSANAANGTLNQYAFPYVAPVNELTTEAELALVCLS
jgi:hypothetical protein